ncbi:MAG: ISAs1 family transposase [Ktedonobacteraceae bacterium]
MNDTTLLSQLSLPEKALLFDLEALYACLQTIPEHRDRRGLQYPLASLLMIGVLAKLAGQDSSRAMAHWAKLRTQELSQLFHLKRERMPHYSTWSRVLGHAVEPAEVEQVLGQFFTKAVTRSERQRGSIQLALDGKTLRGTIPLGETRGVHLLAAYLPKQGVVLAQMRVDEKSNEITHAPKLLQQLDLRGVVVSGDAMFDQRALSIQIVQATGDYLWMVKDNQEGLREEIAVLFQPHRKRAGTSALPTDFRTAQTVEKGHGRLETRTITVSSMLADYSTWPELAQVFKLESQRSDALGITKTEVRYGVTSLPASLADPNRLLELSRDHWGIENGLHYRRDSTMREDHAQLRMGHAPEILAALNNTVLGLLARQGEANIAQARRAFAYHLEKALAHLAA